jgi:alcohol dehydrogenase YqhD (iron-dependent ADH family)
MFPAMRMQPDLAMRCAMQPFVYEALPVRVVFGSGTVAQIKPEADRLGVSRVLVLSTPGRGEA